MEGTLKTNSLTYFKFYLLVKLVFSFYPGNTNTGVFFFLIEKFVLCSFTTLKYSAGTSNGHQNFVSGTKLGHSLP
jgi:hypothetical protein